MFADGFKFWLRENFDILKLRSFAVQLPSGLASRLDAQKFSLCIEKVAASWYVLVQVALVDLLKKDQAHAPL